MCSYRPLPDLNKERQEVLEEAKNGYRPAEPIMAGHVDGPGVVTLTIRLENVAEK